MFIFVFVLFLNSTVGAVQAVKNYELSNIRNSWNSATQKERIVIDLNGTEEIIFFKKIDNRKLVITLEASLSKSRAFQLQKILQKTKYINSANITILEDDNEVIISLLLSENNVDINIFSLSKPSRVVVDLNKSSKKSKKR